MAHFDFVISQNAKWGHAGFYIDRHRMTSLLTCAWLISILWLVLGLQSKIKICIPENILLQKSTGPEMFCLWPLGDDTENVKQHAAAWEYVTVEG